MGYYCPKSLQEYQEKITKELHKDVAAEFESKSNRKFPPLPIDDLLEDVKREIVHNLKKKYKL